jgi:hypothetical protein
MRPSLRPKPSYSNVVATLALFVALGGAAVAAGLPKHSVGARQLKRGAVTSAALRRGAVTSPKLAPGAVTNGKLGPSAVGPGNIGNGAVTSAKLGGGSVIAASIRNGAVTTNKLDNGAVTTAKLGNDAVTAGKIGVGAVTTSSLANGSVTAAKLGSDVAPLLGTLRSGQTLRGVFDLGGDGLIDRGSYTFQFPLANAPQAPETNVLAADQSSLGCPGLKGTGQQTPEAAPGQLCVYLKSTSAEFHSLAFDAQSVSRLGFGLVANFDGSGDNLAQGFWAVTAP